jgi:hypothetical protein
MTGMEGGSPQVAREDHKPTSRQLLARLLLPLLLVGCDGRDEPLEPHGPALASAVVGTYELTVNGGTNLGGGQWQVPNPSGWTLVAQIAFPNATPVTGGTVVFYFLLDGRWLRAGGAAQVNANGVATFAPGVGLPTSFRFKYTGKGSGVKNGLSNEISLSLATSS